MAKAKRKLKGPPNLVMDREKEPPHLVMDREKRKLKEAPTDSNFNPAQLSTIEEARDIAARITFAGGIAPVVDTNDYHNDVSGIYLAPWSNPTGATPEPQIGDARPFAFKFKPNSDGFAPGGFNVGLIRQTAIGHAAEGNPPNWGYALESLEKEVQAQIDAFDASK